VKEPAWKEDLRNAIADHAVAIEGLFTKAARPVVSIVVRCEGLVGDADVVVTAEKSLQTLVDAIRRRMEAGKEGVH
jgi:hypothetical protein